MTMPIELWWWIVPLLETGILVILPFGAFALILNDAKPYSNVPLVIVLIGSLPTVIAVLGWFMWLVENVLFVIWRC